MSTKRQKVAASLANFGVALSLLAAIACVFQPGGRKLRFAGPCGKDL